MKRSSIITSVESRLRFLETELLQRIVRQLSFPVWKRRPENIPEVSIEGYETVSYCSTSAPLKGMVHICFMKGLDVCITDVPARTSFLVTCIKGNSSAYIPSMKMSLS